MQAEVREEFKERMRRVIEARASLLEKALEYPCPYLGQMHAN